MSEEMVDIVGYICLFGWIPILAICSGISRIVLAFKGISDDDSGIHINVSNKRNEENESEDEF